MRPLPSGLTISIRLPPFATTREIERLEALDDVVLAGEEIGPPGLAACVLPEPKPFVLQPRDNVTYDRSAPRASRARGRGRYGDSRDSGTASRAGRVRRRGPGGWAAGTRTDPPAALRSAPARRDAARPRRRV